MTISRRALIMGLGAIGGLAGLGLAAGCARRVERAVPASSPRPRYFVHIVTGGGMDPVYTTDPKTRAEVAADVDVPYEPEQIVRAAGLALGPHWAPLAPFAGSLAILNGVHVGTANHEMGLATAVRMRTRVDLRMPSLIDVIAAQRRSDGPATGALYVGGYFPAAFTPGWIGSADPVQTNGKPSIYELIDRATPDELHLLARTQRTQAHALRGNGRMDDAVEQTVFNMESVASLFDGAAAASSYRPETWTELPYFQAMAEQLQRVLWILENDLSTAVHVHVGGLNWDSHFNNHELQTKMTSSFVPLLVKFLGALKQRRNAHGPLWESTALVVGSEIGRFPKLNDLRGKDHFPERAVTCVGPWFRGGTRYGVTGSQCEAAPLDVESGTRASKTGHRVKLDDVGATVLKLMGIRNREAHGYRGRPLDFLLA